MIVRHAMIRPTTRDLPAGLGCIWMAVALSQQPAWASGVLLPGQPSGFSSALPGQPGGFGAMPSGQAEDFSSTLPGQSNGFAAMPSGQAGDFSSTLPGQPNGFTATPSSENPISDVSESLLRGLKLGANFSSSYNSNISPNQNVMTTTAKDDFILNLGGTLNYLSKASDFTFGGNYNGNYTQYFNHPDLSGYNQGGGLVANHNGGRWSVSGTLGMSINSGSNTNYASNFVKQTLVTSNLTARYRLNPKISLQGNFSQNFTNATGATGATGNYSDTSSLSFDVSALWRYSPLTEFGPGVRYSYASGSTQLGRTSIGPTLNLNYKLSNKVALNSRVGMDFSSYDTGASAAPSLSASIGLNYQVSRLWGMDLSLYRDTQADPINAGAYTQVTSLRLGYHHKILRAMWNLGTSYQTNSRVLPGSSSGGGSPNQNSMSFDTSLSMLTFSNTTTASVFLRFNDQSTGTTSSWNSVQTGFSLSRSF